MRRIHTVILCAALISLAAIPAWGGQVKSFCDTVDGSGRGETLFRAFVEGLKPEQMEMTLSDEPDDTGRVRQLFLNLAGCNLGGVRIDRLEIEAIDVQFTPCDEWTEEGPDIENMLMVYARAVIRESDVNKALVSDEFGDDDGHWHDISLDLQNGGVYVKGYYLATFIFRLDILIELEGKFGIVGGKQVWLEDYSMRVNRMDVPEYLTEKAISKIQPIIDLNEFVFPLTLRTVEQKEDEVILRSRVLPAPFEGLKYVFTRSDGEKAKTQ